VADRLPLERPLEKSPPLVSSAEPLNLERYADRFSIIDEHALRAGPEHERTIDSLASYLVEPALDDLEKTRAIYRWITDRIAYDVPNYLAGRTTDIDCSPEAVLSTRRSICEGYASLFLAISKKAGLEAVKVIGYAKGYGNEPGTTIDRTNHAWNAVKIAGRWYLLDSTWGAGGIEKDHFKKRFEDYYFLVAPEHLIFSHFPEKNRWQLLEPTIPRETFENAPRVDRELFRLGIPVTTIREVIRGKPKGGLVSAYKSSRTIKVVEAPLTKHLLGGDTYRFVIRSDELIDISAVQGSHWIHFDREGNQFSAKIPVIAGELLICFKSRPEVVRARGDEDVKRYRTLLEYVVD
jgi:hypothetical protein